MTIRSRPRPTRALEAEGPAPICGVDEAGRGPWAGPVVAAAVILNPARIPEGIDDSKRLTAARREALLADLLRHADIGIGRSDVAEIDELNILQASHLAMRRAVLDLRTSPAMALIDGNLVPSGLECQCRPIIGGDARCLSIAAASIVAKVARDGMMLELEARYPGYGMARHKGYASQGHRDALRRLGPSAVHRRSFHGTQPWLF